jgi:hypothetical protein
VIFRSVARQAKSPKSYPAMFVDTVRFPSVLWGLAASLALAMRHVELPKNISEDAGEIIGAFVIVSLTLVVMSITVRALSEYGERQGMQFAAAGLSRALIRVVVVAFGATALLANFGVQITWLLGTLGVGGLAVALALQDTLPISSRASTSWWSARSLWATPYGSRAGRRVRSRTSAGARRACAPATSISSSFRTRRSRREFW